MKSTRKSYKGFSLIEILVAIALIVILGAITIVAIDPAKLMAKARNATRADATSQLISAVNQYLAEPGHTMAGLGTMPDCNAVLPPTSVHIGTDTGLLNLTGKTDLSKIPTDPIGGTLLDTGYTICQNSPTKVKIAAPGAELSETIVAE